VTSTGESLAKWRRNLDAFNTWVQKLQYLWRNLFALYSSCDKAWIHPAVFTLSSVKKSLAIFLPVFLKSLAFERHRYSIEAAIVCFEVKYILTSVEQIRFSVNLFVLTLFSIKWFNNSANSMYLTCVTLSRGGAIRSTAVHQLPAANDDRISLAPAHHHKLSVTVVAGTLRPPTLSWAVPACPNNTKRQRGRRAVIVYSPEIIRTSNSGYTLFGKFLSARLAFTGRKTDDPSRRFVRESMVLCRHCMQRRIYFYVDCSTYIHWTDEAATATVTHKTKQFRPKNRVRSVAWKKIMAVHYMERSLVHTHRFCV